MTSSERPVAIVTGASRGIGRAIASGLAATGMNLVVADCVEESAASEVKALIEAAGTGLLYVQTDIARADDRRRLVETVRDRWGRCDLLVNNAGVAPLVRLDLLEATEESFDRVLSINLKGPYFLTQAIANWMIEQRERHADRACRIVNIGSISAFTSSPGRGEYCVSKAGVAMMTALYADRLAEFGIGVFEIRPGIIATDMTAAVKDKYDRMIADGLTPIRRWGVPEDVAKAVAAIAKGHLDFSTGEVINVDGGFHLRRL
ncbi:MAG TPA: 3-ketoacyl-ACP reductase [Planctomycetaceae bacterium]|nr:3-ketoacyl-ACP reductase [Planctomycetaceae bacterium]